MISDLELEIGAGLEPESYQVRVVHSAAGGEPTATLRLDVDGLLSRRDALEATILASAVPARRVMPVGEQPVHQVGKALFESVFTGPVYGTYRASLGVAQQRGTRLRVVLRLTAPELAVLPWETLLDPETGAYLCRQEPLVRHVSAPFTPDPLEVRLPLQILGLVASPRGLPLLDVEGEQRRLAEALAGPIAAGRVELTWVPQASWAAVHERLLAGEWHVLHFVGHGDYDARTQEGLLALVGQDGRADLVEASRLADLLGEAEPTPRLVVLNSCSSGEAGVSDLFSGTAAALVHSGVNAVAAMQFSVSDAAAIAFARGFYTALAHGRDVDEAARSGRIEILGARGTLEWVTPVLYLRGETTQLFTLSAPPATPRPKPGPDDGPNGGISHEPDDPRPDAHRWWRLVARFGAAAAIVLALALGIHVLTSPAPAPKPAPPIPTTVLPTPSPAARATSCGANITVSRNTSCAFAANVKAVLFAAGGGSRTIRVFSPVTGQHYLMRCVAGIPTVCRGGNNAVVSIR